MTPLRVLLPLALLVAITLAEYPSSNQVRFLGKDGNSEDDIIQPGNPRIETEKVVDDTKKPNDTKTSEKLQPVDDTEKTDKTKETDEDKTIKPETPTTTDYRLPEDIEPKHYTLELNVNQHELPQKDYKYKGSVGIDFVAKKATKVIKFHYDRRSIYLNDIKLADANTGDEIKVTEKEEKNLDVSICELTVEKQLDVKKNYTLTLKYDGVVNDKSRGFYKGSYLNNEGERRWYAVTHFEPLGARSAFPCFDEPALKAEFTITITHSSGYEAISNMPVDDKQDISNDWKKVIFEKTPKMSTYLVAFAITDFGKTSDKATVYARNDVLEMGEFAAKTGEEVLAELEKYTDVKYKLSKIDQIALPLLSPGAMENWGLVTYRETALLYDKDVNATIDQQKVASIIAHEFAHQWFGNLVSPKWWSYIWLNEGFATYFEHYIADKINPEWRFMDQFNAAVLQGRAFVYDADLTKTRPMDKEESEEKEIGDMFDDIAYKKAGSVIRMFSHVIREDNFKKGLKNYLNTNAESAATSADLFKALDEVTEKKDLPEDTKLSTIFADWATKKGYPVITVTKNRKTGSVTVKQEQFYVVKSKDEKENSWYVPLNYVQENEKPDFKDTSVMAWLKPAAGSLQIKENIQKDGWIIFNVQQTGYYRVNYDKENWNAIALYLNGENFTNIHPLNRAQLIDDALNLAKVGKLGYDVALSLLEYLTKETDYIVWKSVFGALTPLNKLLATTEYYDEFSKYLVTVTENLLSEVTLNAKEDDAYLTKLLRADALKWACNAGSEVCLIYATQKVNIWLSERNNSATLPRDLNKALLCGALRNATFVEWNSVFAKYALSTNTEEKALILSSLGCSSSPETLQYLLDVAVQPDSIFTGRLFDVFQSVYTNNGVGVRVALDFISENIDKLLTYDAKFNDNLEKYVKELGSRIVLKEDVEKLQSIVAKNIIPQEKTQDALDLADRNNQWYEKYGKDVNEWFNNYNAVTESPPETTTEENSAGSLSFTTLLLVAPLALARLR